MIYEILFELPHIYLAHLLVVLKKWLKNFQKLYNILCLVLNARQLAIYGNQVQRSS